MKRHLIIIDPQRDFCKPEGALYVRGADEDMRRLAEYVTRESFDRIHVTLDSHQWVHIAHPIFWVGPGSEHPAPFTVIQEKDLLDGAWRASQDGLREYALEYVRTLAAKGRYSLTIWPPHCIITTPGHAVHDELALALRAWSEANLRPIDFWAKGSNVRTEHYSAIQADVPDPSDPATSVNQALIGALEEADELMFAGEALDYCLLNTVRDLVDASPEIAGRIVLLKDASSSISGCTIDDHEFFQSLLAKGARLAKAS
ncbi:isochorismatase family protein [bacterium]|nr:MAG: isochorismatase family protein [bacterium]